MLFRNDDGPAFEIDDRLLGARDRRMMRQDARGNSMRLQRSWIAFWKAAFAAGDVVLDVGANIGLMSVHFATLGAAVHAFEPSPRNYRRLRSVTRAYRHIVIHPVALSDRNRVLLTKLDDSAGAPVARKIRFVRYDDYAREAGIGQVSLVKMDIEGMEELALDGMRSVLAMRPVWQMEYHCRAVPNYAGDRFDMRQFEEDHVVLDAAFRASSIATMLSCRADNFFLIPREKLDRFRSLLCRVAGDGFP